MKKSIGKSSFLGVSIFKITCYMILLAFPLAVFAQDSNSINALRQIGKAFSQIAEKATPAVVWITSEINVTEIESQGFEDPFGGSQGPSDDDIFNFFFRRQLPHEYYQQKQTPRKVLAVGSGFIVSPDGYILTNNHVVKDANKVTVKLSNGSQYDAKIIGKDADSDVAVLKIDGKEFPYLELADSDKLEVGEWVIAIGNPFGLSGTVTAGIVSAKGRSGIGLSQYEDFIQTDAAINRGNSGGPLLNIDAKVVGINTAIIGPGGNIGIGLAIPVNIAKNAYEQLKTGGKVERGFLGVGIQDLTEDLAKSFGVKETKGALITEISPSSVAEKAGLQRGDIILELNGQTVEKADSFRNHIAALKPGSEAKLVVLRNEEKKDFVVMLGQRSDNEVVVQGKSVVVDALGITAQNLTDDLAERLGYQGLKGVVVSDVKEDSVADLAGITKGLLIQEVNRNPINNVKDFEKAIRESKKEGAMLLLISNGQNSQFLVLKWK